MKLINTRPNVALALFAFGLLLLVTLPVTTALDTLGEFDKYEDVELLQTCATCEYITISKVYDYDTNKTIIENVNMTKDGSLFKYTLNSGNFTQPARYIVLGHSESATFTYDFRIAADNIFRVNLSDSFTIIVLIGLFFLSLLIYFKTKFPISVTGATIILFEGIILYANGFNPLLSFFIIVMGVGLLLNEQP